jgi:hypothetical protein
MAQSEILSATQGFLHPSKFVFVIDTPELSSISFNCQTVNIPTISVAAVDTGYRQYTPKSPGDKLVFDDFNATFLIDEDMTNYKTVYEWLISLVQRTETAEPPTKRDVTLLIYSNNNQLSTRIQMIGAFPVSLSPLEFQATLTEDDPLVADVSFAIDYYEIRQA